ncbi:hypothetical protein SAMN05421752_11626 [Natronorubrum thiooxidans]|uniref:Uncharacterized protein n=1 Tax=Natronorubrum thiooxidans TaxID=308853 RepID=A0A1N7GVR8_9EURY|nr:hypothetical protein SAMN05421752_11626 [Natronorubrum thiooxidans]
MADGHSRFTDCDGGLVTLDPREILVAILVATIVVPPDSIHRH